MDYRFRQEIYINDSSLSLLRLVLANSDLKVSTLFVLYNNLVARVHQAL